MQHPRNPSGDQRSNEEQTTVRRCSCETSCQLNQELEETKAQLKRQKFLKEQFINKEKETRRELERLKKYTDPETLSAAKIANQVRDNTKRKKKKLLQVDYEELQVAHIINDEKFNNELQHDLDNEILQKHLLQSDYEEAFNALQEEREKNKSLQQQLDEASVSLREVKQQQAAEKEERKTLEQELDEITQKYETEVIVVRQQADTLQCELEKEIKSHAVSLSESLHLIQNLKAEQEAVHEKMAEEMTVLQQSALEGQKTFWNELDELRTKLIAQVSLNLELSTELQAEREALQKIAGRDDNQPPKEAEEAEDKQCEQQAPISPALHDLDNEILQKHLLQSDYEEAFNALQEEREKNKSLQQQLDEASVSLHEVKQQQAAEKEERKTLEQELDEITQKYETEVIVVRQQADTLQCELEKEIKSHAVSLSESLHLIQNLKAEQEAVHRKDGRGDDCPAAKCP
ncbi:hypothetical protein GBF38_009014 [Nibea albiflora]|uniref:Uncharacterized protein n=1 Tax=Nibea albiflora TaxID=240163 RepID=A0ACB7ERG9_NIBAL|nr:hypothetical protein GBF38_009014 [Nibea albiflora]